MSWYDFCTLAFILVMMVWFFLPPLFWLPRLPPYINSIHGKVAHLLPIVPVPRPLDQLNSSVCECSLWRLWGADWLAYEHEHWDYYCRERFHPVRFLYVHSIFSLSPWQLLILCHLSSLCVQIRDLESCRLPKFSDWLICVLDAHPSFGAWNLIFLLVPNQCFWFGCPAVYSFISWGNIWTASKSW